MIFQLIKIFCTSYSKSFYHQKDYVNSENLLFIDIGYNKTSIIYYYKNYINFFNFIPIGSNNITKDLSTILNVDLKKAEKIKLFFNKDENILFKDNFSHQLVENIICARVNEILELSIKPFEAKFDTKDFDNLKIFLMGSGANIFKDKFKEKISYMKKIDLIREQDFLSVSLG